MEQFGNMAGQKGLLGNKSLSSTFVALSPEPCVTAKRMLALAVAVLFGRWWWRICLFGGLPPNYLGCPRPHKPPISVSWYPGSQACVITPRQFPRFKEDMLVQPKPVIPALGR